MRVSGMMAFAFTTLVLGFTGLDLIFLLDMKWLMTTVAVDLILCALSAWYMMAHIIFLQLFGRDILPIGRPWINSKAALKTTTIGEAAACGP